MSINEITKSDLVNITLDRIYKTYYDHWDLSESEFSIHDDTFLVTCRNPTPSNPNADLINGFLKFNAKFLRYIIAERSKKKILDMQHVGLFAADFAGSRKGYASQGLDPHIHGVWVIHPKLRQETLVYMQAFQFTPKYGFHRRKIDKTETDLRASIDYCLKGIMNERGFYKDRASKFEFIGPRHNKY